MSVWSCHECETKRKFWVPTEETEPQTHGIHAPMLYIEPQRLYGERGLICCEVLMTRVRHTARIGNIDRVMFEGKVLSSVIWGTKPVNIPSVFLWPSLLFTCSIRLFIKSTLYFLYVQLEFLCGQLFTFNKINFCFLYGQLDFLYSQLLLFLWSSRLFMWSTFHFFYRLV